jgi:hypothetical protein
MNSTTDRKKLIGREITSGGSQQRIFFCEGAPSVNGAGKGQKKHSLGRRSGTVDIVLVIR